MPRNDRSYRSNKMITPPDPTYSEVRQSFVARLHREQVQLADLHDVLGSAQFDPAPAFVALETFAHRLRGAAAVFGLSELRDAAKALELAAGAAVSDLASADEPIVQDAIQLLAGRLSSLNAQPAPTAN